MSSVSHKLTRISELEGLRALLAWWVVADHLMGRAGYAIDDFRGILRIVRNGSLAVDVFIMLSGFVVFLVLDRQRSTYLAFLVRRLFRLYPVYLLCLFLGGVGVYATHLMHSMAPNLDPGALSEFRYQETVDRFGHHLVAHLVMLHGAIPNAILPFSTGAILDPAWSVSLEWQFYLIAPAVLAASRSPFGMFLVGGLAVLFRNFGPQFGEFDFGSFLPLKFYLFWAGGLSYLFLRWVQTSAVNKINGDALLVVAFLLPLAFVGIDGSLIPILIWAVCLSSLTARASASAPTVFTNSISRMLSSRQIVTLGNWSYCTYLVHLPIIQIARYLLFLLDPSLSRPVVLAMLTAVSVPIILLASFIISAKLEKPGIELGRRIAAALQDRALQKGLITA